MKNKKLIIGLIILLSLISISLIIFMVGMLNGNFKVFGFRFNNKVSQELVMNEIYQEKFQNIYIDSDAGDIHIKESYDKTTKVIIYGDENKIDVKNTTNDLSIEIEENGCKGFCFNYTISKIEVYLPQDYVGTIDIENSYGNIAIDNFENANIHIDANYGDVEVGAAKELTVKEDAGDVDVGTVISAKIENHFGDIEVDTITGYLNLENNCGDIKLHSIVLDKNSYIKDDLGDIEIQNTNEIYIDAETSLGDVDIKHNYPKSDVTLQIENNCGDIEVNN